MYYVCLLMAPCGGHHHLFDHAMGINEPDRGLSTSWDLHCPQSSLSLSLGCKYYI